MDVSKFWGWIVHLINFGLEGYALVFKKKKKKKKKKNRLLVGFLNSCSLQKTT